MVAGVNGVPGVHALEPVVVGLSFLIVSAQIQCHRMEDPIVWVREWNTSLATFNPAQEIMVAFYKHCSPTLSSFGKHYCVQKCF